MIETLIIILFFSLLLFLFFYIISWMMISTGILAGTIYGLKKFKKSPIKEEPKKIELKKFEDFLKKLIGHERLEKVKEKAEENLGVSINSELLTCEYSGIEWVGKTVEEIRGLIKEKLFEASDEEKENFKKYLKKSDENLQKLLKENERKFIEFEKTRTESLNWFIKSEIKNIRINPCSIESWLNWENVEKRENSEFQVNQRAEEMIDCLVKAGKNIDLVLHFGNKKYFGTENRYNIPYSEEEKKAYINFCGFIVKYFKGKINRFEISSEPNVQRKKGTPFEKGSFPNNPVPELYGKVAAEAAEIIKERIPEAEIIFGNIALFDPEFLKKGLEEVKKYEEKLRREGKINPNQFLFNYVGFHPYRKKPEDPSATIEKGEGQFTLEKKEATKKKYSYKSYDDQIEIYEKIIKRYSSKVKLINTEVGWQTTEKKEHSYISNKKTQSEYLLKAAAIDASHGISTNFFELFERSIGEKYSLINKENMPKEGLENLEKFNKYLDFIKKSKKETVWTKAKREKINDIN